MAERAGNPRSYRAQLRERLESHAAETSLYAAYEKAIAAAERREYTVAEQVAYECHASSLNVFGEAHAITILFLVLCSEFASRAGDEDRADRHFQQAFNALLFPLLTASSGNEDGAALLGVVFDAVLSEPVLHPVVRRFEKKSDNLTSLGNLGAHLLNTQPLQACHLTRALYVLRKETLGSDDDGTLLAAHKYALALAALHRFDEARPIAEHTFNTRMAKYGLANALTLRAGGAYAHLLYETGRRGEAIALQRTVYETSARVNGVDHPQTLVALNNLAAMNGGS